MRPGTPLVRAALVTASLGLLIHFPLRSAEPGTDLDKRLRTLEKEIAAVRGLAFKVPVQAQIIARPAEAAKSVQGYYSPKEKRLFLYDDIKGSYQQGVLIHEMVHALQDQHFDLTRLKAGLHEEKYGSDAELALAALIEGDATYTMIEVLKKEQPKVLAMLDAPLEKAKHLQNAFLYAQGALYVQALKDKGGWARVNSAYKFPPRATASIFHLKGIPSITLGPGQSRGAFAVFKELADQPSTRVLALPAALGWRGDQIVEHKAGRTWTIACSTRESAALLEAGLVKIKDEQAPFKRAAGDGGPTWIAPDGGIHGVHSRDRRVWALSAPTEAAYKVLFDQLEGPPAMTIVATREKKTIPFGEMIERLLEADLVCVGETHDSEPHHRVQHHIIKALFAHDERLGVGLEMFQRPFQKEMDRYSAGASSEAEFLKATQYDERWGFEWSLYQPIVEFCRRNGIPLAALNAPRELTSRISAVGAAGLTEDEKKQLGPIDFHLKEHRDYWFERLSKLHGTDSKRTPEQKERSYQVMTVWDDYMAASAATFQQEKRLRRLVILAGSGHIDHGFGIPQRAARRTGGKALTVSIQFGAVPANVEPTTDYVVFPHSP